MVRRAPAPQPTTAGGYRDEWTALQQRWLETIAAARALDPALLHVRVGGEWSFVETLRHLVFVTDAWASRALLGVASPFHPYGLPPTGMRNPGVPPVLQVRPTLDEMLALRATRLAVAGRVFDGLTDEALADGTVRVRGAGHPRAGVYPVARCVQALLSEEWHHRSYAVRDLAGLSS